MPIVVIDSAEDAAPLAAALLEAGIFQAEVTLRTPAALESARRMAAHDGLIVGIGTVLTPEQVDAAAEVGAKFVVSPGLIPAVVERAMALGLTAVPGVATATELANATSLGLSLVKVFPVASLGGVEVLSAFASVFPGVRFMPSGGIGPANAGEYLRHPAVATIGGSWMVPRRLIREKNFSAINNLCASAIAIDA